jgi:hypothetical protein
VDVDYQCSQKRVTLTSKAFLTRVLVVLASYCSQQLLWLLRVRSVVSRIIAPVVVVFAACLPNQVTLLLLLLLLLRVRSAVSQIMAPVVVVAAAFRRVAN